MSIRPRRSSRRAARLIHRRPIAIGAFLRTCVYTKSEPPGARTRSASVSMPRSASGERCSSTSSDHAFVNVPSANGSRRRSPRSSRHLAPRVFRKERADVDADRVRAQVAVPQQRAAAAAAEIDHAIAGAGPEEFAQHVVADLRSEQRRRDALVARVRVERFVQILRLLRELIGGPQVEVLPGRRPIPAAAPGAHELPGVLTAGDRRLALGTTNGREELVRDHVDRASVRPAAITSTKSASSRSARRSQL